MSGYAGDCLSRPAKLGALADQTEPQGWHDLDGDELAAELVPLIDSIREDCAPRRERIRRSLQLYEQRDIAGLNSAAYTRSFEALPFALPLYSSLVDTVVADIAGQQRPKAQVQTSGADWKTLRRAKKLDYFAEGCLHQPQGVRYINGWDLCTEVFRDIVKTGEGVIHAFVEDQGDGGTMCYERVYAEEIDVDPVEAYRGEPLNFFRTYHMDAGKAVAKFVDGNEDLSAEERERLRIAIWAAAKHSIDDDDSLSGSARGIVYSRRLAKRIKIREAWRVSTPEQVGAHAYCIDGATLLKEEYRLSRPPFVFGRWDPHGRGWGAAGLIEQSETMVETTNEAAERLEERVRLCANKRTYYQEGTVAVTDLESNEAESFVPYTGSSPPVEVAAQPFTPAEFSFLQWKVEQCFALRGVSLTSATAQKSSGITSGVGMRMERDLGSKRMAVQARRSYEYLFIDLARLTFEVAQDWVESGRKLSVKLPDRGEIDFGDANIKDDYRIRLSPGSAAANDAAGQLSTAQELYGTGLVSPDSFRRVVYWLDLDRELSREDSEHQYVEALIDRFLDAEDGDFGDYESPDGYLTQKERALMQVGQAYFEARRLRAPEHNLTLLRNYMKQLDELLVRAQAPQENAMGPGGAPVAGPPGSASPPPPAALLPPDGPLPPPAIAAA